jgi:hypothetical protein
MSHSNSSPPVNCPTHSTHDTAAEGTPACSVGVAAIHANSPSHLTVHTRLHPVINPQ